MTSGGAFRRRRFRFFDPSTLAPTTRRLTEYLPERIETLALRARSDGKSLLRLAMIAQPHCQSTGTIATQEAWQDNY
jgi:hypothetical protein